MISIVVPMYNEKKIVRELHARLFRVMRGIGEAFEIIFVDDGSSDGTFDEICALHPVRGFRMKRNFGQTAATMCGIEEAKGDVIVTMDGDLENSPEDIPMLIKKIREGYDVVAGWRKSRWKGQFITRRIPSLAANKFISFITGVRLHDHGCCLRAYRKDVFDNIYVAGEMHRMLAAYLGMQGARVAEVPIGYAPRRFGKSNYGLNRIFKVLLDALAIYFFKTYGARPMHFFGYAGFVSIGLGIATSFGALYLRLEQGVHFNRTPLPVLIAIFVVVGVQFVLMGLLAEIMVRLSRKNSGEKIYEIKEAVEKES